MRQQVPGLQLAVSPPPLSRFRPCLRVWGLCALAGLLAAAPAGFLEVRVAAQMPNARSMSGLPRSVLDLPVGTVSVRLVRGELTDVVAGHAVELLVAGKPQVVKTDDTGRAEFKGIAPGTTVAASATLDGEHLQSEPFSVPAEGGVRMLLVATKGGSTTAPAGSGASRPATVEGTIVLGGDSRIVIEFADDELEVFYLLDIMNAGSAPVKTEPLVFEMPAGAQGTGLLEGSSPQATVDGARVTVSGPFQSGRTIVQMAYSMAPGGDTVRLAQKLPAALAQVSLLVQKVGAVSVSSPAIRDQRETVDGRRTLIMASGPGLAAGATLEIELAGLPHRAVWPTILALVLAALVLGIGTWGAARTGRQSGASQARQRLEARREQMLAEVVKLDGQLRGGRVDAARHAARRGALMGELERIYGALDTSGAGPGDATEGRPGG